MYEYYPVDMFMKLESRISWQLVGAREVASSLVGMLPVCLYTLWTGFAVTFLETLIEWLYSHVFISRAPSIETDCSIIKLCWSSGNILEELKVRSVVIRQNYLTGNGTYERRMRSNRTSEQIVAETRGEEKLWRSVKRWHETGNRWRWWRWWWKPILIPTISCGRLITTSYKWNFTFIGTWLRTVN